ncbi:unnamed protein product [Camellia sinensis]
MSTEVPTNKVTLFVIIVFAIIPTSLFNVYNVCKVVQARKGSMLLALAMEDYLSPYDLIGNYPHLVIVGTGFAFGFLVGRMILSHLCDEPKGLKTSMCMSLFYLPFAIANALTARLNDGVPLVDDRWVLLLVALPSNFRRSGGYCVCRLETSVGCGSDLRSANTSNEKMKQGTVSLPDELIFFDILARLVVRSLLLFRSVSKLWCSLISSPAFVSLNLIQSRADHPDGFALLISVRDRRSSELVLLPASHGGDLATHFLTLPDSTKHHSMSKNLNGLLCLHHPNRITSQLQNTFHSDNSMHICNPSTREIVKLPVNFQTPKFSVHVRLWIKAESEIFTLGTDSWRKIYPVFPFDVMVLAWLYGFQQSVCLNNAIHFILCCKGIIVAFDLRDENFRVIPLPRADIASANLKTNLVHGIALSAWPYMIQVNGLLAVICYEHVEQNIIEMWVLKGYHSEVWIMQSMTFLSPWADLVCPLPYGTIYTQVRSCLFPRLHYMSRETYGEHGRRSAAQGIEEIAGKDWEEEHQEAGECNSLNIRRRSGASLKVEEFFALWSVCLHVFTEEEQLAV